MYKRQVQEGKQVVYLVPTTILAQQHYNTFVQRMKDFPVRVDLMCRFKTAAEQKKTITDLQKGLVDILIGTHRVLSDDIKFKDLGLLIIDEEQRFGVTHKEKIKKMKENVDEMCIRDRDYFDEENTLVILDETNRLTEHAQAVEQEFRESMEHRLEKGYLLPGQADLLMGEKQVISKLNKKRCVSLCTIEQQKGDWDIKSSFHISAKSRCV